MGRIDMSGCGIKGVFSRTACATLAIALAAGLGGCSVVRTFTTPAITKDDSETVQPKVSTPAIVEDGVLTVAMDTTDAPQAMLASDGTYTGYNVDVARALAQSMGLKVKIVQATDPSVLKDGSADIFLGVSSTNDFKGADFAGSCLEDASALFVKTSGAGNAAPTVSAAGLNGVSVAVQSSSASQDALARAGISAQQQTFSNVNECFEALDQGSVQYVACDATAGCYLARSYGDIAFAGIIGPVSSFGIAVRDDNAELSQAVKDALQDISDNGVLESVHIAWYGNTPSTLADSLVSGVTITQHDDADDAGAESQDGSELNISGDLNSLGN